jgi:hypothetical protein
MRQIVGRFMAVAYEFRGIRSIGDLRQTLDWYDSYSEFPIGSEWSYLRFFVPNAFAAGWRLSRAAGQIWNVASRLAGDGDGRDLEIPMQTLTMFVSYLLQALEAGDGPGLSVSGEQIEHALRYTGFIDLCARHDGPVHA